ncbi:hypothetical protein [Wolbachia endosymbiont of Oedothorax gibbosus]|nr:hypothetical protein [Wolbachia endosymbiont of Oedothorax gibbosus]
MAKRAQERCHSSAPFFVIPVSSTGMTKKGGYSDDRRRRLLG